MSHPVIPTGLRIALIVTPWLLMLGSSVSGNSQHETFSRWLCAETVRIFGFKADVFEGLPQLATLQLGMLDARDSRQKFIHVIQLDTYTSTPTLYQIFLPTSSKPAQGFSALLSQQRQENAPYSVARMSPMGDHTLIEVTIPQMQDFEGKDIDANIAVASLKPLFRILDPGDLIKILGVDGEMAQAVRTFIAETIQAHFKKLQRGDQSDHERLMLSIHRKIFESEKESVRQDIEAVALNPQITHFFAQEDLTIELQSPGSLSLPRINFFSSLGPNHPQFMVGPMSLTTYLRHLFAMPEVQGRFLEHMNYQDSVSDLSDQDGRLFKLEVSPVSDSQRDSLRLNFTLLFRAADDEEDDGEDQGSPGSYPSQAPACPLCES